MITFENYGYVYEENNEILILVTRDDQYYVFLESLSGYLYQKKDNHNITTDIMRNYDDVASCIVSVYPEDMTEEVSDVLYKGKTYRKLKHFLPIDDAINYLTIKTNYSYSINSDLLDITLSDLVDLSYQGNLNLQLKTTKFNWLNDPKVVNMFEDVKEKNKNDAIENLLLTLKQQLLEVLN